MNATPLLRYLVVGQLNRIFLILPDKKTRLDVLGGNLVYAASGLGLWETGIGLISRVGNDFPMEWIERTAQKGLDRRGIHVLPQPIDSRLFIAYLDSDTIQTDNPVAHFNQLGLPFPKELLDYHSSPPDIDSRSHLSPLTIRLSDIPADYLDATAAHLCPLDFLSHSLLPSVLRQGQISTITIDPSKGYMNPSFWDDMPTLLNGITAFLSSEEKMRNLFQGRTSDLWEMAQTLSGFGCEIIVIKRGERGQYLYDNSSHTRWEIPAYPSNPVDQSGTADAFSGGFLAGYRRTYDPIMATLYGNISSSIAIEGHDAFYAMDALQGLAEARLQVLRDRVRRL